MINTMEYNISTLALKISELLKARSETIAVAESSSGGLISAALLAVPGASAYFKGGGVVYTRDAKRILMRVSEAQMVAIRPATEAHALDLGRAAKKSLGSDWGIGETGAAGPEGNRYGDLAGHSAIGIAGRSEVSLVVNTESKKRYDNMVAFATAALDLLYGTLKKY